MLYHRLKYLAVRVGTDCCDLAILTEESFDYLLDHVSEYLVDHRRIFDAGDYLNVTAAISFRLDSPSDGPKVDKSLVSKYP
jgi:hypothetical protein